MKILIIGSAGQLGKTLEFYIPKGFDIIKSTKKNLNLLNNDQCYRKIQEIRPDWIINCAAYTNVDMAEKEKELAFQINGKALDSISKAALITGTKILHISTDFVFDGKQNFPYKTNQKKNPLNTYGLSKSKGEDYLIHNFNTKNQAIILRTSWLMSPFGNNFATKMLELMKTKNQLGVVFDQIGCPTSTFTLSKLIWRIISRENIFEENSTDIPILHYSDCGIASWYDVAINLQELFFNLNLIDKRINIFPIKSIDFSSSTKRPRYSILDSDLTYELFRLKKIHWSETIRNSFSKIYS